METKKTIDQNPEEAVKPEENIKAVEETATQEDGTTKEKSDTGSQKPEVKPEVKEEAVSEEKEAEEVVKEEVVADEEVKEEIVAEEVVKEEVVAEEVVKEEIVAEEVKEAPAAEVTTDKEPEISNEEPEAAAPEPEAAAPEPEATAPEPEATAPEPEATDQKPEASAQKPASSNQKPASAETVEEAPSDKEVEEELDEEEAEEVEEVFEELGAEDLITRLEELVQEEEFSKTKTKIALIKVAFMRILKEEKKTAFDKFIEEGGNKDDYKPQDNKLEKRFNKAFDVYRKNKIKFNAQQDKLKIVNLEKKKEILEKLKALISSEDSLKKTYDEFRELQAEWKKVGMVPSGEVSNLWQSYHFLVEKFFDKVKINKELRDLDMKKNLDLKVELCEKTEELLLETSIIKSFKQLQKFHEEWKELGPVPQEKSDEIWERFKTATDKINERRREHYGKLQDEQEQNLLAKTGLCEQVEELISTIPDNMKGWQDQTNKMNELFGVWKSIGRAPKKENVEIWDRFKGNMNTFYSNKKEFLNSIKQEQVNNYNLKVELCVEAENLMDSTDWKRTTQELIRFQQDWKKIGPVPRKHSDKIWKRFRAACDTFFNNKSSHFSSIHENEQENLDKKVALIEKIKEFKFSDDKAKNLDLLKEFQREWMQIGYVPMKDKEKVQQQFREVIDARLDELKISSTELSNASYTTRMEAVKDSPDAERVYRKEISFLTNKVNSLRDDIILWENNLGFFANSKKADVLKQEFEQKIEKAKQDLAAMEAKVKYLRKMASE